MNTPPDDKRLARLIYQSHHRGTKEMDLLLGRFAEARLAGFSAGELAQYEALLDASDPDLYNWIMGVEEPSCGYDHAVMHALREFHAKVPG